MSENILASYLTSAVTKEAAMLYRKIWTKLASKLLFPYSFPHLKVFSVFNFSAATQPFIFIL